MKVRKGFVSNSSSSSFVCDVCKERFHGWDASPEDFEHEYCEAEHIVCSERLIEIDGEINYDEDEGTVNSKHCPICTFQVYADSEMAKYLEITRHISREEVFAEVKALNRRRKKLYDEEYITHVCRKFSLTDEQVLEEIRNMFSTHKDFTEFMRGAK